MISVQNRETGEQSLNRERSANGFLSTNQSAFDRMLSDISKIDNEINRMNTLISLQNLSNLQPKPKPYDGPERRKQYTN